MRPCLFVCCRFQHLFGHISAVSPVTSFPGYLPMIKLKVLPVLARRLSVVQPPLTLISPGHWVTMPSLDTNTHLGGMEPQRIIFVPLDQCRIRTRDLYCRSSMNQRAPLITNDYQFLRTD